MVDEKVTKLIRLSIMEGKALAALGVLSAILDGNADVRPLYSEDWQRAYAALAGFSNAISEDKRTLEIELFATIPTLDGEIPF